MEIVNSTPIDLVSSRPYSTNIIEWLKPVIDLTGFHVYPMNGITEGLNWWTSLEERGIYLDQGDYQWVKPTGNAIKYQTIPSSISGDIVDLDPNTVALDLAYVGSTKSFEIKNIDNIEYIFYSLSKTFGLRNIRTGWIFTREKDDRLDDLTQKAKYYNYFAQDVAEAVISKFSISYVYEQLVERQHSVCNRYDIIPSDVVWLGKTNAPQYSHLRRNGSIARICLSEYM